MLFSKRRELCDRWMEPFLSFLPQTVKCPKLVSICCLPSRFAICESSLGVPIILQVGVKSIVVFLNKVAVAEDAEIVDLVCGRLFANITELTRNYQVEMEIRELLEKYGFDSVNTPVIAGSALCALDVSAPFIHQFSFFNPFKGNSPRNRFAGHQEAA